MKSDEIFKVIEGHPNYMVSNKGRVLNTNRNRYLSVCVDTGGYHYVGLWRGGKVTNSRIHRLVALAFINNPIDHPEVDHIDEDKSNNSDSNLQWCTGTFNRQKAKCKNTHTVMDINREVFTFSNITSFAKEHGLDRASLSSMLSGKYRQHKGWTLC